jgi:hypothetical protein
MLHPDLSPKLLADDYQEVIFRRSNYRGASAVSKTLIQSGSQWLETRQVTT